MTDPRSLALIHAEIDGELDEHQRAELARHLLADPDLRSLRDSLRRLCLAMDGVAAVEPPPELRSDILQALPPEVPGPRALAAPGRSAGGWRPAPAWRHAAMFAAALVGGALLYRAGVGRGPDPAELAGTLAGKGARAGVILDTAHVELGQVAGQVSLYRADAKLGLDIALTADEPIEVLVASGGQALRIAGPRAAITLPGPGTPGQTVELSFVVQGRQIGTARLRVPPDR
jgi:anti-sigma-K factor RskA